jgi:pimeloyl-ACP methyl ester carboxylesterase
MTGDDLGSSTVLSADRVPIGYSIQGTGRTALVFVHGWCGEQSHWEQQVGAFSSDFTVVTLDLAGHGVSGSGREFWTIEAFAADVAAVVFELQLDRVVLIGHSLGGSVVAEASSLLAGKIVGLIGVDTWAGLQPAVADPSDQTERLVALRTNFQGYTDAWIRRMFAASADPELVARIASGMAEADPGVAIPIMACAGQHTATLRRRLRELSVPAHHIAAEGSLFPKEPATADEYGIGFEKMSGVGHFLMLEDPEDFNRRLAAALLNILSQ